VKGLLTRIQAFSKKEVEKLARVNGFGWPPSSGSSTDGGVRIHEELDRVAVGVLRGGWTD